MLLDKIKKILHEYSEKMTIYFTRKIQNPSGDAILIFLGKIFFYPSSLCNKCAMYHVKCTLSLKLVDLFRSSLIRLN